MKGSQISCIRNYLLASYGFAQKIFFLVLKGSVFIGLHIESSRNCSHSEACLMNIIIYTELRSYLVS